MQLTTVSQTNEFEELLALCNEKMLNAAIDLAEMTKHGVNADFIVWLAQLCEDFEQKLNRFSGNKQTQEVIDMAKTIWESTRKICAAGQRISNGESVRYTTYHNSTSFPFALAS